MKRQASNAGHQPAHIETDTIVLTPEELIGLCRVGKTFFKRPQPSLTAHLVIVLALENWQLLAPSLERHIRYAIAEKLEVRQMLTRIAGRIRSVT